MGSDASDARKPMLLVISGAPGSGKTVLAARLAPMLGLPAIGKDMLKETLADAMGTESLEQSQVQGFAAIMVMYAVAAALLRAGVDTILESNFDHRSEDELGALVAQARAAHICCQVTTDLCLSRYQARAGQTERHRCHFDRERLAAATPEVLAMRWRGYIPPRLSVPTLTVDTTDGYAPTLEAVAAWVRQAAG
ncbi:MAG: AAA family ATPase [Anaerolineae bacterium]